MSGNTNILLFGKAKGNGYCQIFFNSAAEAQDFLNNRNIDWNTFIKGNIATIGVAKAKPQKSGYFKIGTEYGDAYISAPKINEMLEEDLTEEKEEIPGIEVNFNDFAENYIK